MRIDEGAHVIAVFGSGKPTTDELAAARLLGQAVRRTAGAVLLTGTDGVARETVKDAAVGVGDHGDDIPPPVAWLGVDRARTPTRPQLRPGRGLVVTPGWDHRRNFVEACLCDAAIAIGGRSDGTASEALFSLYLGRPVVVVGDLPMADLTPAALRDRASATRLPRPERPALAVDRGIAAAYTWADRPDASVQTHPPLTDETTAADLVSELVGRIMSRSPRPDFDDLVTADDWDEYVKAALRGAGRLLE